VAFDPVPVYLVLFLGGNEALPEVFVEDGLFEGCFPALLFPAFEHGIDDVFEFK